VDPTVQPLIYNLGQETVEVEGRWRKGYGGKKRRRKGGWGEADRGGGGSGCGKGEEKKMGKSPETVKVNLGRNRKSPFQGKSTMPRKMGTRTTPGGRELLNKGLGEGRYFKEWTKKRRLRSASLHALKNGQKKESDS